MKVSQLAVCLGIDAYSLILIIILLGVIRARFCTISFPALSLRLSLNQHTLQVFNGTHHQGLPLRLLRGVELEETELPAVHAHKRESAFSFTMYYIAFTRAFHPVERLVGNACVYVNRYYRRSGRRFNNQDGGYAGHSAPRAHCYRGEILRQAHGMWYRRKRENGVSRLRTSALSNALF